MKETMKKMGAVIGILLFGGGALFVISVIMMLFGGSMHMLEATIAGGVALILWGIPYFSHKLLYLAKDNLICF